MGFSVLCYNYIITDQHTPQSPTLSNNVKQKNQTTAATLEHVSYDPEFLPSHLLTSMKLAVINCQSVQAKMYSFNNLIYQNLPDIIVGTESWLTNSIKSSEIFPILIGVTGLMDMEESLCHAKPA